MIQATLFGKRCFSIAERPIINIHRHQADNDIFPPYSKLVVQRIRNLLIKCTLLFKRSPRNQSELDEDASGRAMDTQEIRIE